jgi:hypothetical protein
LDPGENRTFVVFQVASLAFGYWWEAAFQISVLLMLEKHRRNNRYSTTPGDVLDRQVSLKVQLVNRIDRRRFLQG